METLKKFTTSQGNNYTITYLLNYNYFIKHYKMIAIDISKQQALDDDLKVIQQNNFTGNLNGNDNRLIFFIIEEVKETILDFSQETVNILMFYFVSTQYQYRMTQYNTLNVKLSNSQLNKLKSRTQNSTEVTLKLSSIVIGDSKEGNNVLHKILVTNTQASKLRQDFSNGSSVNIKL